MLALDTCKKAPMIHLCKLAAGMGRDLNSLRSLRPGPMPDLQKECCTNVCLLPSSTPTSLLEWIIYSSVADVFHAKDRVTRDQKIAQCADEDAAQGGDVKVIGKPFHMSYKDPIGGPVQNGPEQA